MQKPDISNAKELSVKKNNKEVNLDTAGYFLIRLNNNQIEIGFCNNQHQMIYQWASDSALDLSKAIANQKLNISTEHALYLGRELQRAETALNNHQKYIQL